MEASVHVGVRKGHHELFLGRAVLVEFRLRLENLVGLPARLSRTLHGRKPVPPCERLGLLCVRASVRVYGAHVYVRFGGAKGEKIK